MFFNTPQHYTFSTGGFGITLNALGTDSTGRNYTQCFVVSGAKLYVYIDDADEDIHIFQERDMGGVEGESDAIKANHYAAPYDLLCYPTHFTTNARLYVYAAIPRSKSAEQTATIVYPSQRIDVLGRTESTSDAGETVEVQLGDPDYYYIDLQGRITSADNAERKWEFEIMQGAILGHIIGDEAGGTRAEQNSIEQMYQELLAQLNAINFFEKVEIAPEETIYEVDAETGERILNEDGEPIPVMVQKTDKNGRPLYRGEDGKETTTETDDPVMIPMKVQHDAVRLKPKYEGLFAEGWISALGINKDGALAGGLCDIDIIPDEDFEGELEAPSFGITPKVSELIDVILEDLQDGDTLVWDTSVNGGAWTNRKGGGGGSLNKGDVVGKLWGNTFHVGDNITNSITLGEDKFITFGASGEKIYCIEDVPNVICITAPVQINGGPLIEWDATNKAYHFHGAIYSDSYISALGINSAAGGTGGGGGTDVSWGSYLRDRKVRELNVGGDIENVLLEGALDSFKPSVSWSDITGTTPIWNQDTSGNAATATKLKTPVTLWGNSFDGSHSIGVSGNNASLQYVNNITASGNFTLNGVTVQTGNYFQLSTYYSQIIFGNSNDNGNARWRLGPNAHRTVGDDFDGTFCFWYDNQDYMRLGKIADKKTVFIHKDVCLRIGDGEIAWDATNEAFHFSKAIYSESWISSLGVNNAIIEHLNVLNSVTIGGGNAKLTLASNPAEALSGNYMSATYSEDDEESTLRVSSDNIRLNGSVFTANISVSGSLATKAFSLDGVTLTKDQLQKLKALI